MHNVTLRVCTHFRNFGRATARIRYGALRNDYPRGACRHRMRTREEQKKMPAFISLVVGINQAKAQTYKRTRVKIQYENKNMRCDGARRVYEKKSEAKSWGFN